MFGGKFKYFWLDLVLERGRRERDVAVLDLIGATRRIDMLSKSEDRFLNDIEIERAWTHVEYLSTLDKTSGTEGERRAHEYIRGELGEYGVSCHAYEFDSYISHPKEASLTVVFPSTGAVDCITHAFAKSTPGDGLEAELVAMPASQSDIHGGLDEIAEEYRKIGAEGKIVIIRGTASPVVLWAAEQAGALTQIHISGEEVLHEMIVTSVWGTPTPESSARMPRISSLAIKKSDGDRLLKLLESGTVKVRLKTKVETKWRKIPITVAEIKGSEEPERFMLVHGHMDSWYVGTTDNCTGNAALLELARLFKGHGRELKRSVRIAWWSGHSTGRYSGSTWYADHFFEDLEENCFLSQNIDSPGVKGATDLSGGGLMGTLEFIRQALADATGSEQVKANPFFMRAGDQSFYGIGIPSVTVRAYIPQDSPLRGKLIGGSGGGWWWHSAYDTLDKADRNHLLRDIRMNALAVLRSLNSEVLPFDFAQVADQYLKTLTDIQTRVTSGAFNLNKVLDKVRELKSQSEALNAAITQAKGTKKETIYALNRLLMEVSKILTSTYYARAGRYEHDPAYSLGFVPALQEAGKLAGLDPESDGAGFLRTKMVREVNRVNHQLSEATGRIVEAIRMIT
jgi:Iap family predicted aminopeptidase